MNLLSGVDIIEIARIKKNIDTNARFIDKIYTKNEIEYCEKKNNQKYESYAARFAAKEAIYKAISKYINFTYSWKDFEIINDSNGRPEVKLHFKIDLIDSIDISLSHCKEYAVASVIISLKDEEI